MIWLSFFTDFLPSNICCSNCTGTVSSKLKTYPTDPELTRKGNGVGHWLCGELASELLVLDIWLCGHCGGPTAIAPGPLFLDQHSSVFLVPFSMVAATIIIKSERYQLIESKTSIARCDKFLFAWQQNILQESVLYMFFIYLCGKICYHLNYTICYRHTKLHILFSSTVIDFFF